MKDERGKDKKFQVSGSRFHSHNLELGTWNMEHLIWNNQHPTFAKATVGKASNQISDVKEQNQK